MSEVEKMYKLANVAKPVIKKWYYDGYYEDFSWESSEEDCTKLLKYFDNSIDKLNDRIQQMKKEEDTKYDRYTDSVDTEFGRIEKAYIDYPPFTAEKQISLIIFLSYKYGKELLINLRAMDKKIDIYDFGLFGECLAKLVNELWQDLTDAEKAQIKEVLSE